MLSRAVFTNNSYVVSSSSFSSLVPFDMGDGSVMLNEQFHGSMVTQPQSGILFCRKSELQTVSVLGAGVQVFHTSIWAAFSLHSLWSIMIFLLIDLLKFIIERHICFNKCVGFIPELFHLLFLKKYIFTIGVSKLSPIYIFSKR